MPNKLKYGVLHCTATPEGREVSKDDIIAMHTNPCDQADGSVYYKGKKYKNRSALPAAVRKLSGRGWGQVGYSRMIHLDGEVESLVPYNADDIVDNWEITNGVAGINSVCRHFVYVGGTDKKLKAKDTRTDAQKSAMESLIKEFITQHPDILIAGHNQFAAKACPSFDTVAWLKSIGVADKNIYKK